MILNNVYYYVCCLCNADNTKAGYVTEDVNSPGLTGSLGGDKCVPTCPYKFSYPKISPEYDTTNNDLEHYYNRKEGLNGGLHYSDPIKKAAKDVVLHPFPPRTGYRTVPYMGRKLRLFEVRIGNKGLFCFGQELAADPGPKPHDELGGNVQKDGKPNDYYRRLNVQWDDDQKVFHNYHVVLTIP